MASKGSKVCCWVLLGIGVFFILGMIGMGLMVTAAVAKGDAKGSVKNNSYLLMDLSGVLPDYSAAPRVEFFFGSRPNTMADMLRALHQAAGDSRIKGLILRPVGVAGFAEIRELRNAILEFRKSKKPVYAYLEMATDRDYYLASVADSIIVSPSRSAGLAMLGLSIESTYWARTFEKVGIKFYALHVGEYKGAFENYSADHMSEPLRASLQTLLDDLYNVYTSDIVAARPAVSREALNKELLNGDQLIIIGPQAVQKGLADLAADWGDFREHLKGGEKELETISPAKYVHALGSKDAGAKKEIAVVFAEGDITYKPMGADGLGTEDGIEAGAMIKLLRKLREDEDVAAVVLRVNSPGGSAYASELILQEVKRLKAVKPVVVSMANVAASGGYYISCEGQYIVAQPNTVTGSIGVVSLIPSAEELYRKLGANVEIVERGKWGSYFRLDHDLSGEQQAVLMGYMSGIYDEFVERVAEGRNLPGDSVRAVAAGRVWTGQQALDRHLVDELGGLDVAVAHARELAKVTAENAPLRSYPREKNFLQFMFEQFNSQLGSILDRLTVLPDERAVRQAVKYLNDYMLHRDFVQAVLPINLP
jgi:protease IV